MPDEILRRGRRRQSRNLDEVREDHIGFANFIKTNYGLDITPSQVKAVYLLKKEWSESQERVEMIEKMKLKAVQKRNEIALLREQRAKFSLIEKLEIELDSLEYELTSILKLMQPGNRQKAKHRPVPIERGNP